MDYGCKVCDLHLLGIAPSKSFSLLEKSNFQSSSVVATKAKKVHNCQEGGGHEKRRYCKSGSSMGFC